jgi:hypothetical protein
MAVGGDIVFAADMGQAATAWTPALTATTTSPTLGTGGSSTGVWWREGKFIYATARFVFGTAGVAAGAGDYRISLPVAASASIVGSGALGDAPPTGTATMRDASAIGTSQGAIAQLVSATSALLLVNAGGVVGAAAPWVWALNDRINCAFVYPID